MHEGRVGLLRIRERAWPCIIDSIRLSIALVDYPRHALLVWPQVGPRSMLSKWCSRSPLFVNALGNALQRIDAAAHSLWRGVQGNIHSEVMSVNKRECDSCSWGEITGDDVCPCVRHLGGGWSVNAEELSVAALLRAHTHWQLWHFLPRCRGDTSSLAAGSDLGHSLHRLFLLAEDDVAPAHTWRFWFLFNQTPHKQTECFVHQISSMCPRFYTEHMHTWIISSLWNETWENCGELKLPVQWWLWALISPDISGESCLITALVLITSLIMSSSYLSCVNQHEANM